MSFKKLAGGAAVASQNSSPRGDKRREALLAALDEELRTTSLDDISVSDLTNSAGITRSAFYFYFDSKAAAVTVLLGSVLERAEESTTEVVEGEGGFRRRVENSLEILADRLVANAHIYRALLTARMTTESTRELWDEGRAELAEPIAEHIRAERAAGRAPEGADPTTLARALVQLNESVLEQLVYATSEPPRELLLATATDMWVRCVYGRPDPDVDPA
ncbi:MAG TPA: TetR/AcrR family transcriptional regulator [Candidatus Dietzia intestinipullorum]|nr:TetR/AcrR family transcriptional regulator [Candidatus Dietzia intestinipullorum]